jgi:hypothetical protein
MWRTGSVQAREWELGGHLVDFVGGVSLGQVFAVGASVYFITTKKEAGRDNPK